MYWFALRGGCSGTDRQAASRGCWSAGTRLAAGQVPSAVTWTVCSPPASAFPNPISFCSICFTIPGLMYFINKCPKRSFAMLDKNQLAAEGVREGSFSLQRLTFHRKAYTEESVSVGLCI